MLDHISAGFVHGNGSVIGVPARPKDGRSADDVPLNPKYTFEAFVIGPSNRFAHAAALSVAEAPARAYNPLFIYGAAGLGKTHLLQAIGNYVARELPAAARPLRLDRDVHERVRRGDPQRTPPVPSSAATASATCCSSTTSSSWKARRRCRRSSSTPSTRSTRPRKQIVLTSDRPPGSIATLEDRLRSRFLSGLITDIQPPELETRIAILRTKAEHEHADRR